MRLDKAFGIPGQHGFELLLGVLIQIAGGADGVNHGSPGGIVVQKLVQALLVLCHIRDLDVDKIIVDGGVQDGDLIFHRYGRGAVLLEHLHDALALCQTRLGVGVQIRAELRKGLQLAVRCV